MTKTNTEWNKHIKHYKYKETDFKYVWNDGSFVCSGAESGEIVPSFITFSTFTKSTSPTFAPRIIFFVCFDAKIVKTICFQYIII